MKLIIGGYANSGKDTFAEMVCRKSGMTCKSSSMFAIEEFIFDAVGEMLGYGTPQELYENRDNHRALLYELICAYNGGHETRLGEELFKEYDIYVGIRSKAEFWELSSIGAFDLSVWVDRPGYSEDSSSCDLSARFFDVTVNNNSTVEVLEDLAGTLCRNWKVEQ